MRFLKNSTEKIYWTHYQIFFSPIIVLCVVFFFFLFFFFSDGSIASNLPPSCPDFEEYLPLTSMSILLKENAQGALNSAINLGGSQKLLPRQLWRLHPASSHPLGRQCQLIVKAQHVRCCHPSALRVSEAKLKGWLNVLMAETCHNNDMARSPCLSTLWFMFIFQI